MTTTTRKWYKYTRNDKLPIQEDIPTNRTLRLNSRKPACLTAKDLIKNQFNGDKNWRVNWFISNSDTCQLMKGPYSQVSGFILKRK